MGAFDLDVCLHANRALANEAVRAPLAEPLRPDAQKGAGASLGVLHTTPFDLAASQWELWGDGRSLVGDAYRVVLVYSLLEKHGLQPSLGTASQISTLVKRHLARLQEAGFEAPGLTGREAAACRLAEEYCGLIREAGLVELCQALGSVRDAVSHMRIRVAEPCVLDEPLASFYAEVLGRPSGACLEPDDGCGAGACAGDGAAGGCACVDDGLAGADGSAGVDGDAASTDAAQADFVLLKPQGATVVEKMVFDEVRAAVSERGASSVAVVSPDPLSAYECMAAPLRDAGALCALEAAVPFSQTGFGRFYLSACKLFAMAGMYGVGDVIEPEDESWIDVATDVALSSYAGIPAFDASVLSSLSECDDRTLRACDLNTVWRADRTLIAQNAAADLAEVSAGFKRIQVLFSLEGDPFASLARFRDIANGAYSGLALQFELAAVSSLESMLEVASSLECPSSYMALFPKSISVAASVVDEASASGPAGCAPGSPESSEASEFPIASESLPTSASGSPESSATQERPLVYFVSIDSARQLPAASFDETVLCDVTDAFLNAKDPRSAADLIASKFGFPMHGTRLDRVRQAFLSAASSARGRFACVFPMRDADSQETFASFVFDEFVERRFAGAITSRQLVCAGPKLASSASGAPAGFFEKGILGMGEEGFVAGAGRRLSSPVAFERVRAAERGRLSRLPLMGRLPSVDIDGKGVLALLSPSSIEAYLDCPYKWFLERVVNPKGLDEQFGPLERGNLAHSLMEGFYAGLKERFGAARVDEVAADDARELFEGVAKEALAAELCRGPNSGRYAPASKVDAIAAGRLVEGVYRSIVLHSAIPKRFAVAACEQRIGALDAGCEPVEYAGFAISGKVDRVDVDAEAGSFCVLDYKGSLDGHAAGDSCVIFSQVDDACHVDPGMLPRHVQALVYAQALLRLGWFGTSCEAALYTSYRSSGTKGLVTGSYRHPGSGMSSISDADSGVGMEFSEFLDLVEEAVEARLSGMRRSEVPTEPSCRKACEHCCFSLCERRM